MKTEKLIRSIIQTILFAIITISIYKIVGNRVPVALIPMFVVAPFIYYNHKKDKQ